MRMVRSPLDVRPMTTPGVRAINCCSIGSLGDCRISADVAPCGAPAWLIGVGRSVAFGPECEQAASKAASTRPPLTWRRGRDDVTVRTDVSDMKASSVARRDSGSHATGCAARRRWAERLVCLLVYGLDLGV